MISGGIFDVADKENLLVDINNKLSEESTWSNLDLSQNLNKEKADLEKLIEAAKQTAPTQKIEIAQRPIKIITDNDE